MIGDGLRCGMGAIVCALQALRIDFFRRLDKPEKFQNIVLGSSGGGGLNQLAFNVSTMRMTSS